MWTSKLQDVYRDFEEWENYDECYGLAKHLGFKNAWVAWEANPTVQGSTKPEDYKVVKDQ